MSLLVYLVIVLHAAAIAFMLTGGLLALRWPRILWFHIPISLAIFALFATGTSCPITDLAVIDVTRDGLVLREVAPGVTADEVLTRTGAPLTVPDDVPTMPLPTAA